MQAWHAGPAAGSDRDDDLIWPPLGPVALALAPPLTAPGPRSPVRSVPDEDRLAKTMSAAAADTSGRWAIGTYSHSSMSGRPSAGRPTPVRAWLQSLAGCAGSHRRSCPRSRDFLRIGVGLAGVWVGRTGDVAGSDPGILPPAGWVTRVSRTLD